MRSCRRSSLGPLVPSATRLSCDISGAAPQSALADGFFEEGGKMAFKMRPNTLFHIHISASVRFGSMSWSLPSAEKEEEEEEERLRRLAQGGWEDLPIPPWAER